MANVEESVYSDPNFAVICSFLEKFGDCCGIPAFTIVTLQEMLEDTRNAPACLQGIKTALRSLQDRDMEYRRGAVKNALMAINIYAKNRLYQVHQDLVDLHVKLLRRSGKKSVTQDKWEKVLVKYCHGYSKVDAWEIERFGYKKAKLGVKISLLKRLLEAQFDVSSKFKTDINKLSAEQLRLLPIGKDLKGLMYWFQLDHDLNLRVYCEDQDEETWELVVRERGELVSLIQNLESNGNPGLKKEEDSTTPSDTGESKDGEGSLGIQVPQVKQESLPDEKLQFCVPLLTGKEEGKPQFEVAALVSVKEEKNLLMKPEPMETDVAENMTLKEETTSSKEKIISLKVEKSESQDSSVSDVPSVELKEAEMTVKIKEEPMLIDEDTIVEPKILEMNGSRLQSITTNQSIPEAINSNSKWVVEDQQRNNEPPEMENGLGEAVQDLSSSVRVSVIKHAEKPVNNDTSSNNAEVSPAVIVPQTVATCSPKNSQEEATDLSMTKKNNDDTKSTTHSGLECIPSTKDPEPAVVVMAPEIIKESTPSKDQVASDKPGPVLPTEIVENVVREPIKLEQEPSDRIRCERMKMPLKKRNIPKDLDTGDSRPVVMENSAKCQIPLNMEHAPVQPVEKKSDAITSPLLNPPEPIVPPDTIHISSQIAIVPVNTEVTINDKLESVPSNSNKSPTNVPKKILTKNEKSDSTSVELIDTGQTLTLVKSDSTPGAKEQRHLAVVANESSESIVNGGSNKVEGGDLKLAKLRLKKSEDGSTVIDVRPEEQSQALQLSGDKETQGEKANSPLEECGSQILERTNQSERLNTKSADPKTVEKKPMDTEETNIKHLSSKDILEGITEVQKVKALTETLMRSSETSKIAESINSDKKRSSLQETDKTDKENADLQNSNEVASIESLQDLGPQKSDEADDGDSKSEKKIPITGTSSLVKVVEKETSISTLQTNYAEFEEKTPVCSDSHQSDIQKTQLSEDVVKQLESSKSKKAVKDQIYQGNIDSVIVGDIDSPNTGKKLERTTEAPCNQDERIDCISEVGLSESKRTQGSEKQKCKSEKRKSEDGLNSNTITEKESTPEEALKSDETSIIGEKSDSRLDPAAKDLDQTSSGVKSNSNPDVPDVDAANACLDGTEKNEGENIAVIPVDGISDNCRAEAGNCNVSKIEPVKAVLDSKDSDETENRASNDAAAVVKHRKSKNAKLLLSQKSKEDSLPSDSDNMVTEESMEKSVPTKSQGKSKEICSSQELAVSSTNNDLLKEAEAPVPERRMTRSLRPRAGQSPVIVQPAKKERKKPGPKKGFAAKQKKEAVSELEPKVPKRMGRPPKGRPKSVKVVTPNKPRGRKKATEEVQSSGDGEAVLDVSSTPTKKRKLESCDLEEDPLSSIKRSPRLRAQRQKVQSEQQLIEEEMQRRALVAKKKRNSLKKKKKLGSRWAGKGKKEDADEKELSVEEELETGKGKKKFKKKKHLGSKRRKKGTNPWDVSSGSTSASSEPEERNDEAEDEDEELVFNDGSDHEFSPESEPEEEDPNYIPIAVKRARTVKQAKTGSEEESSSSEDDKPCNKCGRYDHPEWILLCDKCDIGYHTSCLRPPLLVIPDGDWYCPPCGHKILVERLTEQLKNLDQLLKKRDREEMRKKRLAYVGISLDNVLKPEKKESVGDEEELEEERDDGETDDDYTLLRKRSKRQRKEVSYRFKEFDELIKSAIHDEPVLDSLETGVTAGDGSSSEGSKHDRKTINVISILGIGKGKDMSNITSAPPEESDFDIISNRKKRKHRRLNDLDTSTEEEDDSDEDFNGASTNSEQITEEDSGGAQEDSDDSWQGEHRSGRSNRRRRRHDDSDFINDSDLDSEDNRRTVRRAAAKSVNYRELSDSDDGGRRRKRIDNTRAKSSRGMISDDSEEESEDSDWKKSKKRSVSSSKPKQRTGRKAWRIDSDDDDEEDEKDARNRHTRGKKTSYEEVLDSSNSEEEVEKSKKNSRLKIGDFAKDSEDEESSSEEDSDEEDDAAEERVKKVEKVKDEEKVSKGTTVADKDTIGNQEKNSEAESPPNKICSAKSAQDKTCPTESSPREFCGKDSPVDKAELKSKNTVEAELQPKKSRETDTASPPIASQSEESNVKETSAVSTTVEKVLETRTSTDEADIADAAESATPVDLESTVKGTLKASVIKSTESVKKEMLEGTKAPSSKLDKAEKDSKPENKEKQVKPAADAPGFAERARLGDFPDRPSPLKPSAVEPYPVESSPSKLMLLDTYPPVRGSPQSKLTPLEPYSTPTTAPPFDRPRMAGPSSQFHGDYGNYPGQYYSPNYPPPSSQYSPSPPMPAYQSSPNPYPPFQQPSPNYGYMPQGYGEQGPYHGPPQQYGSYGNYSPPPQPPPSGPPAQPQPNGRFTIDNLLQRRMEGASEDDDFSTVNDLVSYITGSSSTSQENPL